MTKPCILVFAYHEMGYECLDALIENDEYILAVITHQDNPEEKNIWFRPVAALAAEYDIPVYTPETVNTPEWIDRIRQWAPDLIFSFSYQKIINEETLKIARLGAWSMHDSLLPRYRGRASINWAVQNGEKETGVTLHQMIKEAGAGGIVDQETVLIDHEDSTHDVLRKSVAAARLVLERQFPAIATGTVSPRKQDESQATVYKGRKPQDGLIDWTNSSESIFNLIRANTHPYSGAFTFSEGKKLYLWQARPVPGISGNPGEIVALHPLQIAAGTGGLEIEKLQFEGDEEQDASFRIHGLKAGQILATNEAIVL